MNPSRPLALLLVACALAGSHVQAGDEDTDAIRAASLAQTQAWFETIKAQAATNTHWLTLPNILIDTQARTITFKAEATGLSANETMEFMLIGQRSGHAYEAMAVAMAEPIDIANAIQMLGLSPGLASDPSTLRFWPKGERVHLYLNEHHAADLMLDQRTGKPMPRSGFIFTASHTTEVDGQAIISAQVMSPFSIAANYNEPRSILDVPIIAPQSAVYSFQVQNPDIRFAEGELLTIRIEPENRPDGSKRVQDLKLQVSLSPRITNVPAADLLFSLAPLIAEGESSTILPPAPLEKFLVFIRDMQEARKDPFVEVHMSDNLTLRHVNHMAHILDSMQDRDGLRISPPPKGTLYHRAFTPDESMRVREDRMAQPWELHLSDSTKPILVLIEEEWTQGELKPKLNTRDIVVEDPATLAATMSELRPDMRAVFVYAPADMTLGSLMDTASLFMASHPLIHIFTLPAPPGQTSGEAPAATSE